MDWNTATDPSCEHINGAINFKPVDNIPNIFCNLVNSIEIKDLSHLLSKY